MEPLAMDGGPRAIKVDQEPLIRWPVIGDEEKVLVMELLERGEISTSSQGELLEKEFAAFVGAKHALAKVNGTACLLAAFHALGIGPGDEVLAPTNTYWATVMPAAFLGARIVFCESEPDNFCIDPDDIEKKITDKTKAIVPVHIYGYPCDMDRIMEIAKEHDVAVIEDASHAHGVKYRGKHVGTFGDCGVFSLQGSKILPAGEAGILVTNDVEIHEHALALGHYERLSSLQRDDYKKYRVTGLGLKHRPSPLHAAIARCQLKRFPRVNATINRNCERFRSAIRDIDGVAFHIPDIPSHVERGYFMNQMRYLTDKKGVIPLQDLTFLLESEGLRVFRSRYNLLHEQPYFVERGHDPAAFQRTRDIVNSIIGFPNFPWDEDGVLVDQYIEGIEKVAHHVKADFA